MSAASPYDIASPAAQESKKRKAAPGSRGVANLTPEQLAKKRANDREAQRAIRSRTKLKIENLERRIRELTSQQPYQELQAALRAKEAVENENAEIKRRLAAVVAQLTPIIAQSPSEHPVLPSPGPCLMPATNSTTPAPQNTTSANNTSTPSSAASPPTSLDPYSHWNSGASTSSAGPASAQPQHQMYRAQLTQQRHELAHGLELGSERLGLEFLLDQAKTQSIPQDKHDAVPPRAAEGFPPHEIIGPRWPSISSLLNPLREAHPLSKVFIDILHTFPNISQLPERVAVLYAMFLLMRWKIDPSQDNYDRLPEHIRPLPCQFYSPHPAWIDHLPFPAMREKLIQDYAPPDVFPFENFFVPYTGPENDELMINPVFERHLRKLENWTLGDSFARAMPMLQGTFNLKSGSSAKRAGAGDGSNDSHMPNWNE
ncbi:hypothetical protein BD289DRAFT_456382 [Coniella lustricola]|uniref:BZIP transcription factor n=1 Tax=Coniella lustricola TaxID=2025994 RepID=A0A2T2ZW39_9PEZI|nr:hypothetical protein BD289DRAFT_456382 [Coniella lustricola]